MEGATSHEAVTSSGPESLVTWFKHLKLNVSRTNELALDGTILELLSAVTTPSTPWCNTEPPTAATGM